MKKLGLATVLLLGGMMSGQASAQEMRAALSLESASVIRDTCVAYAKEHDMVIAIAVFNEAGNLVTLAAMDGIPPAIPDVAQWKGKSAAGYRQPTSETAKWGSDAPPHIAVWEGGLPIYSPDGAPLGGVGVSGAESKDDIACQKAGIEAAGLKTTAN